MTLDWLPLLQQFWKMHVDLPLFQLALVFFAPASVLAVAGALMVVGGFVAGARKPLLPKLAFMLPVEVVNGAIAAALTWRYNLFHAPTEATISIALFVSALAVAGWANRGQPLWSPVLFSGFCLTYAASGALYSAVQFLQ